MLLYNYSIFLECWSIGVLDYGSQVSGVGLQALGHWSRAVSAVLIHSLWLFVLVSPHSSTTPILHLHLCKEHTYEVD